MDYFDKSELIGVENDTQTSEIDSEDGGEEFVEEEEEEEEEEDEDDDTGADSEKKLPSKACMGVFVKHMSTLYLIYLM